MSSLAAEGLQTVNRLFMRLSGGRAWWAHFEFTRINIEPIILRKKIEDVREARASSPFRDQNPTIRFTRAVLGSVG